MPAAISETSVDIGSLSPDDLREIALGELRRRERIGRSRRGLTFSEETRRRLSESGMRAWARRKQAAEATGDAPVNAGHHRAGAALE